MGENTVAFFSYEHRPFPQYDPRQVIKSVAFITTGILMVYLYVLITTGIPTTLCIERIGSESDSTF